MAEERRSNARQNNSQVSMRPAAAARPVSETALALKQMGKFALEEDRLSYDGLTIPLSPKELATLRLLALRSPRIVPVEAILAAVWVDAQRSRASVAQCIAKLRRKLHVAGAVDWLIIETAYGCGYRLVIRLGDDLTGR